MNECHCCPSPIDPHCRWILWWWFPDINSTMEWANSTWQPSHWKFPRLSSPLQLFIAVLPSLAEMLQPFLGPKLLACLLITLMTVPFTRPGNLSREGTHGLRLLRLFIFVGKKDRWWTPVLILRDRTSLWNLIPSETKTRVKPWTMFKNQLAKVKALTKWPYAIVTLI